MCHKVVPMSLLLRLDWGFFLGALCAGWLCPIPLRQQSSALLPPSSERGDAGQEDSFAFLGEQGMRKGKTLGDKG